MIYIVTALKPEAQAFVDKYKLHKTKLDGNTLFYNENIKLIVSGIGVGNAMSATQMLIDNFDITDDDIYLNVGICGAESNYKIGELLEIGNIDYGVNTYVVHPYLETTITCLDTQASEVQYEIVDMESFGFFEALRHSTAIKKFHIFKVVSDHFEPATVTKEGTKSLIFNVIDVITTQIIH